MNVDYQEQARTLVTRDGKQTVFTVNGRTFAVRRLIGHSPAVFNLRDTDISERSRFGSYLDIMADVATVLETGCLPGGRSGRW